MKMNDGESEQGIEDVMDNENLPKDFKIETRIHKTCSTNSMSDGMIYPRKFTIQIKAPVNSALNMSKWLIFVQSVCLNMKNQENFFVFIDERPFYMDIARRSEYAHTQAVTEIPASGHYPYRTQVAVAVHQTIYSW